jgi:hypothetical protein
VIRRLISRYIEISQCRRLEALKGNAVDVFATPRLLSYRFIVREALAKSRADRSHVLTGGSSESYCLINSSISANTLVTAINQILRMNSSV